MTTILEALKDSENNMSVNNSYSWLFYDYFNHEFITMERKRYARGATEIYRGPDEHAAVAALLGEDHVPRSEIVSEPGAAIEVTRINLTDSERSGLTSNIKCIRGKHDSIER